LEAANFPPCGLKELEIHLVKHLCAQTTDCSACLNQPRRARNHLADGRARRTLAESKTPSCRRACGDRHVEDVLQRSHFAPGWSRGDEILCSQHSHGPKKPPLRALVHAHWLSTRLEKVARLREISASGNCMSN
jgi:hypothetical protein